MVSLNGPRMSKVDRRRQLLETALVLIRQDGTETLTLARVAEVAGVSKPIAYEHFETRNGLFKALYLHLDREQSARIELTLQSIPLAFSDLLKMFSAAFIDCAVQSGPEYAAIEAALAASEELTAFRLELRAAYLDSYRRVLARYLGPDLRAIEPLMIAIHGAASELAQEVVAGRLQRDESVSALHSIIAGALINEHPPS